MRSALCVAGRAGLTARARRRGIANLVKLSVEDDLSSGSDVRFKGPHHPSRADSAHLRQDAREAARLIDHVDRKLVTQTVMTSVYGVTFIGARDQLFNRRAR